MNKQQRYQNWKKQRQGKRDEKQAPQEFTVEQFVQQDLDKQFRQEEPVEEVEKQIADDVRLYMIDYNQCDSKKCTGRKMLRFKLLQSLKPKTKFQGIILSANGTKYVSKEDLPLLEKGICAIDCSWARVDEITVVHPNERILPHMVAVNPVNFGKRFKLTCVEAIAAALRLVGHREQADFILSKFTWGEHFFKVNNQFEAYDKCETHAQLQAAEQLFMNEKIDESQLRDYQLPSDDDDDSDN